MKKELFDELLESVEEMNAIAAGKKPASREFFVAALEVKQIRQKTNLSQDKFARLIGVEVSTLRNWEQGRRQPTGPAQVLIRAIANDPEHVIKACQNEVPAP
jgi:putative transcriptional regulator